MLLGLSAWVLPGLRIPWPDLVVLPALLMAMEGLVRFSLGSAMTTQSRAFVGWALSVALMAVSGILLPHTRVMPFAAFFTGTLIWLTNLLHAPLFE